MSRVRPVAGGGRAVEVEPERLARWFVSFALRNRGVAGTEVDADGLVVRARDGTTASVRRSGLTPGVHSGLAVDELIDAALASRRVGFVLVRLGAHVVGIAEGERVVASRTNRHNVHGRNAAGGWSQQRFARRRDKQAREALERAARDVNEILVPEVSTLDGVVLAGDRRAIDELRDDRRLAPVFDKSDGRILDIPEPRRAVLDEVAKRARAVEIVIHDPR